MCACVPGAQADKAEQSAPRVPAAGAAFGMCETEMRSPWPVGLGACPSSSACPPSSRFTGVRMFYHIIRMF